MPYVERDKNNQVIGIYAQFQSGYAEEWLDDDNHELAVYLNPPINPNYRIGKSTPWRRMTDDEALSVSQAMKQQTIKNQMIYDAASYIDTSDELFGTLKALLTQLFTAKRADELLAKES